MSVEKKKKFLVGCKCDRIIDTRRKQSCTQRPEKNGLGTFFAPLVY